jgi:hypothetical protein
VPSTPEEAVSNVQHASAVDRYPPIHLSAEDPRFGHRRQYPVYAAIPTLEQMHHRALAGIVDDLPHPPAQHRVGTNLDEDAMTRCEDCSRSLIEVNCIPKDACPVGCIKSGTVNHSSAAR